METLQNMPAATPESVWAILRENAQAQKESRANFDRMFQETDRMFQASAKRHEELDRMLQELSQSQKETDRKIKEVNNTVGGMGNSQGEFAEEYFFNSFENGKRNFFGEQFDEISKRLKNKWQGVEDEFDIVLFNHASVALIEVKYKARETDIPKVLKKADNFRMLFPQYKDFKVYLGFASMSFYPELEDACLSAGIAIIKQVGDAVVIRDEQMKVF